MRPTNCDACQVEFFRRPGLEDETRRVLLEEDASAAQIDTDAALQEFHDSGHKGEE